MEIDKQKDKYALHAACREGQTQLVTTLLTSDRKLALVRDEDDRLPLHWAAAHNHIPIIDALCDASGSKLDIDAQDGAGWTALMIAASLKDGEELVKYLLDQKDADPNVKTNTGATALHFATSKQNLDVARLLLSHGASARVKDKRGQLPLHRAAAVGSVPLIKLCVKEGKSPVNATDVDGSTALHHAIAEGHGDAAVELLRCGVEGEKKDREGRTAILLAPDDKVKGFVRRMAEEEGWELG